MSTDSVVFSGTSRFSGDLELVLERAVDIASLPLLQLDSGKKLLSDQSSALASVRTTIDSLQTSAASLNSAVRNGTYGSSVSDTDVLSASLDGEVLSGTYSIEVLEYGTQTRTTSLETLPTVTDPATESLGSATTFFLTVDGVETQLDVAEGGLMALAEAINSSGSGVSATVLNYGSTETPNYRLSIQANDPGATTIQLTDGSEDLLQLATEGSPLRYRLNGEPSEAIESTSRSLTIAPGLTINVKADGTADVIVSRTTSNIRASLTSFVTAFNNAVSSLDAHRGAEPGVLSGQSIVTSLSRSLRALTSYSSDSSGFSSLTNLGITFTDGGMLAFDQSAISSISDEGMAGLLEFFGSTDEGGFLQTANAILTELNDTDGGLVQVALDSYNRQIERQDKLIADNERRLELYVDNLQSKLAEADALIASLEQQVSYMTGLFEAMNKQLEN